MSFDKIPLLHNIKYVVSRKPSIGFLLPRLKLKLPFPLLLIFHITSTCNRKCGWCYQKQDDFYSQHLGKMPVDAFEKALFFYKKTLFFKPHIHFSGGEPLLHPEFPLFLKICKKYGYNLTITTNGDVLDEYMYVIKNSTVTQLNISIAEPNNSSFEFFYKSTLLNITNMKKVSNRIIINLNYVIAPSSYRQMEDVVLFFNKKVKRNNISIFGCQHLMFEWGKPGMNTKEIDLENLSKQIIHLAKYDLNFRILFTPDIKIEDLDKYYYSNSQFKNRCYAPWLGLSIYPDLAVTPLPGLLFCNRIIGDLNNSSIADIWHGEKLSRLQEELLKHGLSERCNRCCQNTYY